MPIWLRSAFIIAALTTALAVPSVQAEGDPLTDAQLAQAAGKLDECAARADVARRAPQNTYHAHRLFASCTVFAADAALKDGRIDLTAYRSKLGEAIAALDLILHTPGAQHQPGAGGIIALMLEQLKAKLDAAGN
ncbi:MAG: hypothetical protein NW217_03920 [Hyphomicrobiaceae bacterium]|nr:hypothetical protein [Hyphomicrobiaceae bacterium]